MRKIRSIINILKTMLKTSYDTSDLIDSETGKINKKSNRVWIYGIVCILVLYLSNSLVGMLESVGLEAAFLDLYFFVLQILVIFQVIVLGINVMYFSEDIENYLYLPISNTKLLITKFVVVLSIIFGTELTIVLPSLYIYGTRTSGNILLYCILTILVLLFLTIFLATIVLIVLIPVMRLFRFIKNKFWYQNVVVLLMTCIMVLPVITPLLTEETTEQQAYMEENKGFIQEEITEDEVFFKNTQQKLKTSNSVYIVAEAGVQVLSQNDKESFINILRIAGLDIIVLTIFILLGRATYIKDILWNLSLFDKKKNKKINLNKRCKVKNKKISLLTNDVKDILRNPTFFMHYIYNVIMIVGVIIMMAIIIIPIIKKFIIENSEQNYYFNFENFSIIIGVIQLLFTISPISLTAISRYGKNATFFKYIPIKAKTLFRLKNIPQIAFNTLVIVAALVTINYLFPEIEIIYLTLMFVVSMLLNIINSYILLMIDLKRPQLYGENEISVIQQNDNKLFKYLVTALICVILWYINNITKSLNLNVAILMEIAIFSVIMLILEIIIAKQNDKLFDKII